MKKKRKKLPSISSLEKKLDIVFQTWVRRSAADEGGTVQCVTCNKLMHWTGDGAQAGHFVKRANRGVRWDPRNCHVQCTRCNSYLGGNDAAYAAFIIDKYGRAVFDELMSWRGKEFKRYRTDLDALIDEYSAKLGAFA